MGDFPSSNQGTVLGIHRGSTNNCRAELRGKKMRWVVLWALGLSLITGSFEAVAETRLALVVGQNDIGTSPS